MADEELDVPALASLNDALRLQHRPALQYSLTSGGVSGFDALAIIMRKQNQVDFLLRARRSP